MMSASDEQEAAQDVDTTWAPLAQAALAYGVSVDTLRRRIKRGNLNTRRDMTPQGFRWLVPLPDVSGETTPNHTPSENRESPRSEGSSSHESQVIHVVDRSADDLVAVLKHELDLRNREISRLHEVIAQQAMAIERTAAMLPATTSFAERENVVTVQPTESVAVSERSEAIVEDPANRGVWERLRRWLTGSNNVS